MIFDCALIIAPHADDEILGCGLLAQRADKVHVVFMSKLTTIRRREVEAVAKSAGFSWESLGIKDGYMYQSDIPEVCKKLEEVIDMWEPTIVAIPYKSLHQDHKFTHDVAFSALRNYKPSQFSVIKYEYPEGLMSGQDHFKPDVFLTGSRMEFDNKIDYLNLYESQVKDSRDDEAILALATLRGHQCGSTYAEAYELVKAVY